MMTFEQCFELLIMCNASNSLWYDSLWCVMRTMFWNHDENTMSISYEMVDLGNGFTKIASLGGNGQEIWCLEKTWRKFNFKDICFKKFMKARHLEVMAEANRFPGPSCQPKWCDKPIAPLTLARQAYRATHAGATRTHQSSPDLSGFDGWLER